MTIALPASTSTETTSRSATTLVLSDAASDTTTTALATAPLVLAAPTDATKGAVLAATQKLFAWKALTTGACCILFELVRRQGLFKDEGFGSMEAYAAARLNVKTTAAIKQYSRGGKSAWEHLPELSQRVVDSIIAGNADTRVSDEQAFAGLPSVCILRELGAALDRTTDPAERAALLDQVQAGKATHRGLRQAGREKLEAPGESAADATPLDGDDQATDADNDTSPVPPLSTVGAAPGEGDAVSNSGSEPKLSATAEAPPLPIFRAVEQLEAVVGLMHQASEILYDIGIFFRSPPTRDVKPVFKTVQAIAAKLDELETTVTEHVIPRSLCDCCHGKGRKCGTCGGAGWLPSLPAATETGVTKKGLKPKAAASTAALKGKKTGAKANAAKKEVKARRPA